MALNYLFIALLALTGVAAGIWGGRDEKIGMGIYVAGCVLTVPAEVLSSSRFATVNLGVFIVDCLTFGAFFFFALHADRFWPLWVTAFLGIALFGHTAMLLAPGIVPWAYAVVLSIWSYPILAIIFAASMGWPRSAQAKAF